MGLVNISLNEIVDRCIPKAAQRVLAKFRANNEVAKTIEGDVYDNLLVAISADPKTYFRNTTPPGPGDSVIMRRMPPLQIQLTSNPTVGGGIYTMNAKFIAWNGSAYAVTGSEFAVTDAFDCWHHSFSGHRGVLAYDTARDVLYPLGLNSPTARDVTLATLPLARDASTEWTDTGDSQASGSDTIRKAHARYVLTGDEIPTVVRASIVWHASAESGAGRWYITTIDKCLV